MRRFLTALVCYGMLGAVSRAATTFPWKATFNTSSSTGLVELHEQIYGAHPNHLKSVPVSSFVLRDKDFELQLISGTLFLEPSIRGDTVGAFFEGEGFVSFTPSNVAAQAGLQINLERTALEKVPIKTAYIFTLMTDSPLLAFAKLPPAGNSQRPHDIGSYVSDKSAMRQLGLELTALFLNRDAPAKGACFVLFPMEEIRTPHSEEARVLYAFNPMDEEPVRLDVFGHDRMIAWKPYKFRFYTLASYPVNRESGFSADLERSTVKIAVRNGPKPVIEEATLKFRPVMGLRALRLPLIPDMQVSEVTSTGADSLPFLQWKLLPNSPDFDQTVLVVLPDASPEVQGSISITVKSEGRVFGEEDDWYPHFPWNDEAHHELDLTLSKDLVGIGTGEKVSEENKGQSRRVVFRTTKPSTASTFYAGYYTKTEGVADDVSVELYQHPYDLMGQKNSKFVLTELINTLKVYNRMFVPLDIRNLRVATTRTGHGRGFEGLLLLGADGTGTGQSWAELFRAHEVAHQWWGNYVRPRSWREDRWLAESFAEYSAMEYYRIRYEDPKKAIAIMRDTWFNALATGTIGNTTLTGSKERHIGETMFPLNAGRHNVYTKGPMVINMLRYLFKVEKGNDEAFFVMLRDFLHTYRYQSASTADFKKVVERNLGMNLDWFFQQWVEDGGLPVLKWSQSSSEQEDGWLVKLEARQEQKNYRLLIPVYFHFPGDKVVVRPWLIEGASATRTFQLPSKPSAVTLNDNLEALAIFKSLD